MADKSAQALLDALSRAVTGPDGIPLFGSKSAPGLFAAHASAKQAAQRGKQDGLLRVVRTESRGKTVHEICAITEKGLAFLLQEVSPRQVLGEFVRALERRQEEVAALLDVARQTHAGFDALKARAERVLQHMERPEPISPSAPSTNGNDVWLQAVVEQLAQRRSSGAMEDCPLPELYQRARQAVPTLTIGHFHDGLRRLREDGQIYLHPWTGPLYELPEPQLALLVGHEVAYYASKK